MTFEVKILIYGQFQNSGLPYIFPSSTSFRAKIVVYDDDDDDDDDGR